MSDFEKTYLILKRISECGVATMNQVEMERGLYHYTVKKTLAMMENAGYVTRTGKGQVMFKVTINGESIMRWISREEGKLWISVIKE